MDSEALAGRLHPQSAQHFLSNAQVIAVFDAHHHCADNFSVSLAFGEIVPANLSPEDLCAVEYFESMSVVDLYFVCDVGTVDDGDVVAVSRLDKIDSLVEAERLIHENYIVESTGESQIKS